LSGKKKKGERKEGACVAIPRLFTNLAKLKKGKRRRMVKNRRTPTNFDRHVFDRWKGEEREKKEGGKGESEAPFFSMPRFSLLPRFRRRNKRRGERGGRRLLFHFVRLKKKEIGRGGGKGIWRNYSSFSVSFRNMRGLKGGEKEETKNEHVFPGILENCLEKFQESGERQFRHGLEIVLCKGPLFF